MGFALEPHSGERPLRSCRKGTGENPTVLHQLILHSAEEVGFEPTWAFWTQRLSRAPPLATRPLLRQHPAFSPGPNKKASAWALPSLHPRLARQGSNLDSPDPESGVLPITPRANAAVLQRAPIIDDSPHPIKVLSHWFAGIVPCGPTGGWSGVGHARACGVAGSVHSRNTLR